MDDAVRYLVQAVLALSLGLSIPLSQYVTPFKHLKSQIGAYIILAIYIGAIASLQNQDTARRFVQLVVVAWLCFVMVRVSRRLHRDDHLHVDRS